MAYDAVPVVISPLPFGRDTINLETVDGTLVWAVLADAVEAGLDVEALARTEIYINGERQDRATVLHRALKDGDIVNVVVEPLGGGGGGGRKDVGQVLLQVAVIAISAWVGGGAGGAIASQLLARLAAAVIVVVGQAAIQAAFAPKAINEQVNDRHALQSASNQYRPWGAQPVALGEVVAAPDLVAKTFTQSHGDDVWLYGILGLHRGPCEVEELKIGDTLVSSMGEGDFRMAQHLTPGPRNFSIYPNDVDQLDLSVELEANASSATPVVRQSSSDGQRFEFDLNMPKGLYFQKDDGRVLSVAVSVTVRYRPVDVHGNPTGNWQSADSWSRSGATKDPIRVTHAVRLPLGRYEFELTRNLHADNNDKRHHDIFWTSLKSVAYRKPVADEVLSVIEFAVRATAINQGGLAPITCRIKPKVPVWNGTSWSEPVVSSNPAALTRWLLTGPCAAQPLPPEQADRRLRGWHQLCDLYGWTAHHYLTDSRSQAEVMGLLEKSGRASVMWDGTQLAAACWVEKPAPKQLFSGANLSNHMFEIVYPETVHGLRVEFENLNESGQRDEVYVYADGYAAQPGAGVVAATLIEAMPLDGQMTAQRAYKDGRWALGQRKLQRRFDTWSCDAEFVACERGDRVRLAWDRADGCDVRVRTRRFSGGLVSGLRLSEPVLMQAGGDYVVDIRTASGVYTAIPVQNVAGETREITFASPRSASVSPVRGDLVAFGLRERVTEDVEVVEITPGPNLTAQLVGVRYVADKLMAGETGPIPDLPSRLTGERTQNPPQPVLLGSYVDTHAVRISFDLAAWRGSPVTGFACRWRGVGGDGEVGSWLPLTSLDASARTLAAPPLREAPVDLSGVQATRVEFEIVTVTQDGRTSEPLRVTVSKPAPAQPSATAWTVTARGAADGVSMPVLIVTGIVDDTEIALVQIAYAVSATGPWIEGHNGPPTGTRYELGPLIPARDYWVRICLVSSQGITSDPRILGPTSAPILVASDVIPTAPTILEMEGRIASWESGLNAETSARVEQFSRIQALNPNLTSNGNFEDGTATGWQLPTGFGFGFSAYNGGNIIYADLNTATVRSVRAPATRTAAGAINSSQIAYRMGSTQWIAACVQFYSDAAATAYVSATPWVQLSQSDTWRVWKAEGYSTPAGTVSSRIVITTGGAGNLTGYLNLRQAKTEAAPICSGYSSDATLAGMGATLTEHRLLLVDYAAGQNLARLEMVAEAVGGAPARFALTSSSLGSAIALDAPYVYWGKNTVWDRATATLQTTIDSNIRVIALGDPFGAQASLLEWWGPTGIPISQMSATNGYNGRMNTEPFVFSNSFEAAVFTASASPPNITAHRSAAGPLTTGAINIIARHAKGVVAVEWLRISGGINGFGSAIVDRPNSLVTTFSKTVSAQEDTDALFMAVVTDQGSGDVKTIIVPVRFRSGPL